MKLALASDIHLEFGDLDLTNDENAEVLILSGDICTAKMFENDMANRVKDFFARCADRFPHVVYVMGNHEHYHYDFKYTAKDIKKHLKVWPNIQLLDNKPWTLHDEVTFIGGTLWTDMNNEDSTTMWHVGRRMNDFQIVKNSKRMVHRKNNVYKKDADGNLMFDEKGNMVIERVDSYERPSMLQPEDVVPEFKAMVKLIDKTVKDKYDHKFVVVGHHAPSKLSTKPWYEHDVLMNGAYSSDLNQFILERPQIKLWTHGHTHEDFDYMIGTTRVVCNPRGYIHHEPRADNFKLKYLEV
jgi:Icc-related predicted phosphoesterase